MRDYLPRTWVNAKLVGGASAIHGDGVFAAEPIACGEKLMEFGGEHVSPGAVESDRYRECSVWAVAEDAYLALPENDPASSLDENLNHSCDANAWLTDEVTLVARRDIAKGEEITLDQGTWNLDEAEYTWDDMACGCGARDCRRMLTERDWMLAGVRERYKDHFHPMVQKMIDAQKLIDAG